MIFGHFETEIYGQRCLNFTQSVSMMQKFIPWTKIYFSVWSINMCYQSLWLQKNPYLVAYMKKVKSKYLKLNQSEHSIAFNIQNAWYQSNRRYKYYTNQNTRSNIARSHSIMALSMATWWTNWNCKCNCNWSLVPRMSVWDSGAYVWSNIYRHWNLF